MLENQQEIEFKNQIRAALDTDTRPRARSVLLSVGLSSSLCESGVCLKVGYILDMFPKGWGAGPTVIALHTHAPRSCGHGRVASDAIQLRIGCSPKLQSMLRFAMTTHVTTYLIYTL